MAVGAPGADALLVAIGAVPGAWLRFRVVDHLEPVLPSRHWGTFGVNLIACFALGLMVGLEQSCGEGSRRVLLLIGTGFLGAYTTFSGWMLETRSLRQDRRVRAAAANIAVSVVLGLLAAWAGLQLGLVLTSP